MANHASAEKRNRQRIRRTERNRAAKSAVRTELKSARSAVASAPSAEETKKKVVSAVSSLDRAASKGVIHHKTASRKKARLARALHKAQQAAKPAAKPAELARPGRRLPGAAPPGSRAWLLAAIAWGSPSCATSKPRVERPPCHERTSPLHRGACRRWR